MILGQELTAVQYEPPKPKPMVRPAYLYFMPSPAAMSFNFAVQSYRPGSAHPASHDHSGQHQTFWVRESFLREEIVNFGGRIAIHKFLSLKFCAGISYHYSSEFVSTSIACAKIFSL